VAILRRGNATADQARRVDEQVKAALDKDPKSPALLLILADFRDFQSRFAESQVLYERILQADPANALANNNLAVLLALRPRHGAKALELSQRAIAQAGPAPALLDTRALAYLATGKHEHAVGDLEEAVRVEPTATRYYHLAQAHRAAKNAGAASQALKKAQALGLTPEVLHPLERSTYERFIAE
jgi:cellulose synthase operon protein C